MRALGQVHDPLAVLLDERAALSETEAALPKDAQVRLGMSVSGAVGAWGASHHDPDAVRRPAHTYHACETHAVLVGAG